MIRRRFLCLIVYVSFVSVAGQTSQSTPTVDNSTSLSQTTDTLSNNSSNVAPTALTANSSTYTPGNSSILATPDAQSQNTPSTTPLSTLLSTDSLITQTEVTTRRDMLTTTTTSVLTTPFNDQSQPQSNVQQPQAQSNHTPNTAGFQPVDHISSTIPTQPDPQPQAQSQTAPTGSLSNVGMTTTCPTPVDVSGASYRIFGAFAVYQCRPGYLTARYVSMCLPDSTWLPPNITCKPKDCGNKIPVVDGATSTYDKTIFGSSVMYSCKETDGYHYESGTTTVTCGADGLWSDINLKCALNTYRPMKRNSQQIPQKSITQNTENSLMQNLALFVATAESALSANDKMSAFELLGAFKALLSGQSDMKKLNSSIFSGVSVPVTTTPMPTSFPSLDQQSPPGIQQQFPKQSTFFTNAPSQYFPQQPQFPQPNYQNYQQQQQSSQQQNQPQQQPFQNPFQNPSNQFPYNPFSYNPNNYQQYPSQQFQQFQQQQYPQQYNPRPMNPYPQQPGMNMFPQQQPTGNTFQQQHAQPNAQTNEQQPDSQQQNNQVPVQGQQQLVQAQHQSVQAPRQQQPVQTPQQPVQTPQQPVQNPQATQPLVNNASQQLQPANDLRVQQTAFTNTSPLVPNQSQPRSSSVQNQSPHQQPANTILQQPNQLSQQTQQQTHQQPQQQPQSTNNVFSQNLPQPNMFLPNDQRPHNQPTQQTTQNTMQKQSHQPIQPRTNVFSQNLPTQTNVFSQNLPNQQPIRNTMSPQIPQQQPLQNPQQRQQPLQNPQQQQQPLQNPQQQQQPLQNTQQQHQPLQKTQQQRQPLQNTQQQLQQTSPQQQQAQYNPQQKQQQQQQSTPPFKPQQKQQQQTMGQFQQRSHTNTNPQANQPGNSQTQVSRAAMENALRGILGNGGYNSMSPQLKNVLLGPMPATDTAPTNQQVKTPAQTQPAVTDPYMAMLASATGAQGLNNNMNMNNMFGFGGQSPNNMSNPFAAMAMGTGMGLGGAPGMMNNLMMDPEMVAEMNEQRMAGGAGLNGGMGGALSGVLGGAGIKPGTNPLAAMFGPTLQGTMQGAGTGNPFDAMMTGGHPAAGSMKHGQLGAQDTALMALLNGMAPGQGQNFAGDTALGLHQPTSPVTGTDPSATKPAQQAQTPASPIQAQSPVQPAQSASSNIGANPGVNPAATGTAATNGLNAETMQMMRSLGLVKK